MSRQPATTNPCFEHSMLCQVFRAAGCAWFQRRILRSRSGSRLHYKTFGGARPACPTYAVQQEDVHMSDTWPHGPDEMPQSTSAPVFAAFASIDWAARKHVWKMARRDAPSEQGEFENTPEAVQAWATGLFHRFGGRPIAVCLEQ